MARSIGQLFLISQDRQRERPPLQAQRGFSLLEVMFASTIFSALLLAVGTFWFSAGSRVADLVIRQKAIYVLNAEMERLTALYVFTSFAANAATGPVSTTGYAAGALPTTRLVYPDSVAAFIGGGNDFITTSASTFATGSEFLVWRDSSGTTSRAYVWLDRAKSIAGRISWTTTDINVGSCSYNGNDCSCRPFDNSTTIGGRCVRLDLYIEYPYRIISGTVTPPTNGSVMSLRTIVGRG